MQLTFYKYQGTGNDFVVIDNRQNIFPKDDTKLVARLCDQKFGVGADGLILLENDNMSDFKMVYYNADGNESTMCGNGGRCIVAFAKFLGVIKSETVFNAIDGLHKATIHDTIVTLQMIDVKNVSCEETYSFLNTGSPHHVQMVNNVDVVDVFSEGKKLRYGLYGQEGSNINFISQIETNKFKVRTYERGVENETLSCGTGVTAAAIAMHYTGKADTNSIEIQTLGGELRVTFDVYDGIYKNVNLIGPAMQVFKGEMSC